MNEEELEDLQELEDLKQMAEYSWIYSEFDDYEYLHAIAEDAEPDLEYWCHRGQTLCGKNKQDHTLQPPGFVSRLGAMRCNECCDLIGYPRGKGSPKNDNRCRELLGLEPSKAEKQ